MVRGKVMLSGRYIIRVYSRSLCAWGFCLHVCLVLAQVRRHRIPCNGGHKLCSTKGGAVNKIWFLWKSKYSPPLRYLSSLLGEVVPMTKLAQPGVIWEKKLHWVIWLDQTGHFCRGFPWLSIDAGGLSSLEATPFLGQVGLGCIRKLVEWEPVMQPAHQPITDQSADNKWLRCTIVDQSSSLSAKINTQAVSSL